jgi:hypothetical protein
MYTHIGFLACVAPSLAGAFAATIYLLTKYLVLIREDSTRAGLIASPFFFFTTTTILTMSIGEPNVCLLKSVGTDNVWHSVQGRSLFEIGSPIEGRDRCGDPGYGWDRHTPLCHLLASVRPRQSRQE